MNDLERVQRRSLRIIGLPVDTLSSLCERIEKLTLREMEAITRDTNHPCDQLVPVAHIVMVILLELKKIILM